MGSAAIAFSYPDDIDATKVGIRGWSFGGFVAALGVLARPDVFGAAIAGAPVTDQRLYDTAYSERYLGHPDEHPDVYERNSLIPLAAGSVRLLGRHEVGYLPQRRSFVRHRQIHRPPATIRAKAAGAIAGRRATAPGATAALCASQSRKDSACPVSHQKGAPRPNRSNRSASASSGMMMKVVSGMAITLAKAP